MDSESGLLVSGEICQVSAYGCTRAAIRNHDSSHSDGTIRCE